MAKRFYSGEKRQHVVGRVASILKGWHSSPFELEAATRAGLRSALCLTGIRWAHADAEAADIVEEGLRLIGAVRPTWAQGQREYTIPAENCQWCGRDMADEVRPGRRFCSDVCAKSALQHRDFETVWYRDNAAWESYRVVLREKTTARTCKQCGVTFKPIRDAASTEFCSLRCAGAHRRTVPERACTQCGADFRPKTSNIPGMFCSRACHQAHVDERRIERHCLFCGEAFFAKTEDARYCSPGHRTQACKVQIRIRRMEETGKPYVPRGPEAHLVHRIIDAHMAAKMDSLPLTAAVFDTWFLMAA